MYYYEKDLDITEILFGEQEKIMDVFDNGPIGPECFGGTDEESHYMTSGVPNKNECVSKPINNKSLSGDVVGKSATSFLSTQEKRLNLGWIQLYSGRKFYPSDPHVDDIDIQDIGHSLSNQCRFTGHVKEFYSVAQHSVLVSYLCGAENALWGLLHDSPEAYLVDVPKPLKRMDTFQGYRELEQQIQNVICLKFGLPTQEPPAVKLADTKLLATEARDLMSPLHPEWVQPTEPFPFIIKALPPAEAKELFMRRYRELTYIYTAGGDISDSCADQTVASFKKGSYHDYHNK